MEFDKDGRIILPGSIQEDKERDNDSLILERVQVNAKNPAIAQLRIQLGKNLRLRFNEEVLQKEIYVFCKNFIERSYRYNDVASSINMKGSSIVIEAKSSLQMYSLLNEIVVEIRELYSNNKGIKVSLKGSFDKF